MRTTIQCPETGYPVILEWACEPGDEGPLFADPECDFAPDSPDPDQATIRWCEEVSTDAASTGWEPLGLTRGMVRARLARFGVDRDDIDGFVPVEVPRV